MPRVCVCATKAPVFRRPFTDTRGSRSFSRPPSIPATRAQQWRHCECRGVFGRRETTRRLPTIPARACPRAGTATGAAQMRKGSTGTKLHPCLPVRAGIHEFYHNTKSLPPLHRCPRTTPPFPTPLLIFDSTVAQPSQTCLELATRTSPGLAPRPSPFYPAIPSSPSIQSIMAEKAAKGPVVHEAHEVDTFRKLEMTLERPVAAID